MNDNQNYFVTRSTSRVLAVPGGKCSIDIFGDDSPTSVVAHSSSQSLHTEDDAADKQEQAAETEEAKRAELTAAEKNKLRAVGDSFDLFGDVPSPAKKAEVQLSSMTRKGTADPAEAGVEAGTKAVSSNRFASSATTNSYNVITSRPTSRVLQEPGGKSADIIFG